MKILDQILVIQNVSALISTTPNFQIFVTESDGFLEYFTHYKHVPESKTKFN